MFRKVASESVSLLAHEFVSSESGVVVCILTLIIINNNKIIIIH